VIVIGKVKITDRWL